MRSHLGQEAQFAFHKRGVMVHQTIELRLNALKERKQKEEEAHKESDRNHSLASVSWIVCLHGLHIFASSYII